MSGSENRTEKKFGVRDKATDVLRLLRDNTWLVFFGSGLQGRGSSFLGGLEWVLVGGDVGIVGSVGISQTNYSCSLLLLYCIIHNFFQGMVFLLFSITLSSKAHFITSFILNHASDNLYEACTQRSGKPPQLKEFRLCDFESPHLTSCSLPSDLKGFKVMMPPIASIDRPITQSEPSELGLNHDEQWMTHT